MATRRRARKNPSPPPVPPRRPTPQQLSSSLARVRRIAGSVNERERPFNPERPGSWRGSSRDLVVNPRSYEVRRVHKISPRDSDRETVTLPDSAFSNKIALAAALRKAGVLSRGQRLSEFRVEGNKVIAFPEGGSWHSLIIDMDSAGDYTPNPQDSSSYGAGARLRPGYAFEGPDVPNKEIIEIPNDDWETVMISEDDCEDTRFVQYLTIDGARCSVFERKNPPYGYLAQMTHMARNGEVDPRDIPAHLHGAELRDEPEHNGQDVGYSQGMRNKSAEWFQVEYATGSDYSGGSVNESNYRVLGELLDEHHPEDAQPVVWARTSGGHGTYGIVVRYGDLEDEVREAIDALEDYSLMDEEDHSNLETEQQGEAWENWGRADFIKELAKDLAIEDWDELEALITPDQWYAVFDGAREAANEYWEDQQGAGQYINMKRVAKKAGTIISSRKLPQHSDDYQDDAFEALFAALPEE